MSEATHISQDGMRLSIQTFDPGSKDAAILVRATLSAGENYGTCIRSGFDLTADTAVQMAEALMRHATQLRVAQKGLTVQEYAAGQV